MDYTKNNYITTLAILSLLVATATYICISWTPIPFKKPFFSAQNQPCSRSDSTDQKDELEAALSKASMQDKTVIITVVNKAYVESHKDNYSSMFDVFLESFWLGEDTRSLLDHLLVVAMDQTAYDRCNFRRLHCYRLVTDGVDFAGEKMYMSDEFIKMMWRRTLFLLQVLKRGYNFIFTDTDVMWLRNPFPNLSMKKTHQDLQISTDSFNGNPWLGTNPINTGFYYIISNNKTISLFKIWYGIGMKPYSTNKKEQDVLSELMHKGILRKLRLRIRFLDTLYFSGFCSDSRNVSAVVTVHANCCRSIGAKVEDLSVVLGDWKRFKGNVSNDTIPFQWSMHNGCINAWH